MRQEYNLDRTVRLIINCVIAAGVIYLLYLLEGVLLPFIVGALLAYIFEPIVRLNKRILHTRRNFIPVVLTLIQVLVVLTGICWLIFPMIAAEVNELVTMVTTFVNDDINLAWLPDEINHFIRHNFDANYLQQLISRTQWMKVIEQTLAAGWSVITSSVDIIMGFIGWLLMFLYMFFIMLDYDRVTHAFKGAIPPRYRRTAIGIINDVRSVMNRYFRGQALVAFLVGILFAIGFSIIDLPLAILMGLFIGLLNMVPYLQLISLIPTTLLCVIYCTVTGTGFWLMYGELIAVYCVVQMIQDLILTPRIIGKSMSMNPALIFLSLSCWGVLLGLVGLLIAIPLTTLVISYYKRYVIKIE